MLGLLLLQGLFPFRFLDPVQTKGCSGIVNGRVGADLDCFLQEQLGKVLEGLCLANSTLVKFVLGDVS